MSNMTRFILAACAALSSTVAARSALADGTCTFDAATGVMRVQATGTTFVTTRPNGILMDRVRCGDATVTTVDTIQITGSGDLHLDSRALPFAPGRTPEADGTSEIEINVQLTVGTVTFNLGPGPDLLVLTDTQGDFSGDGDFEVTFAGNFPYIVAAGPGDDVIDASELVARQATLQGGPDDDYLQGGQVLNGDAGEDILQSSSDAPAQLDGGTGDDVLIGGDRNDRFSTGRVADGADVFIGGGGQDSISYDRRTTAVQIAMDGISPSGELVDGIPVEGDRIAVDIESAAGGPGDDVLIGNDLPNGLFGLGGNDSITGGGGGDLLDGGEGDDEVTGGDGDDVIRGFLGDDFLHGGAGNDTITGWDGDDEIFGSSGNDDVDGGEGNDHVAGGDGADHVSGFVGDDLLEGGSGDDVIAGEFGNDTMFGGDGADNMTGTQGDDTFFGGDGPDVMFGGIGDDWLEGGDGPDFYGPGQGRNHIESPSDGSVDQIRCGGQANTMVVGPEDRLFPGCV